LPALFSYLPDAFQSGHVFHLPTVRPLVCPQQLPLSYLLKLLSALLFFQEKQHVHHLICPESPTPGYALQLLPESAVIFLSWLSPYKFISDNKKRPRPKGTKPVKSVVPPLFPSVKNAMGTQICLTHSDDISYCCFRNA